MGILLTFRWEFTRILSVTFGIISDQSIKRFVSRLIKDNKKLIRLDSLLSSSIRIIPTSDWFKFKIRFRSIRAPFNWDWKFDFGFLWTEVSDWIGINRINSDWFLNNLCQTRYKDWRKSVKHQCDLIRFIPHQSKWIRMNPRSDFWISRNSSDSLGLNFKPKLSRR